MICHFRGKEQTARHKTARHKTQDTRHKTQIADEEGEKEKYQKKKRLCSDTEPSQVCSFIALRVVLS